MARFLSARALAGLLMVASAVVLLGWTQEWLWCALSSPEIRQTDLSLTGQEATVLPAGLALVGFALALLLLMASRILGLVIGALGVLVAVSGLTLCITFIADPVSFALATLSKLSGIADDQVVRSFVSQSHTGWGLWCATFAFALTGVLALLALVQAPRWQPRRSRYETSVRSRRESSRPVTGSNTIDAWDEITRGDDPTA